MRAWARRFLLTAGMVAAVALPGTAMAAKCGSTSAGFEAWKADFAAEAKAKGIGAKGLKALSALIRE